MQTWKIIFYLAAILAPGSNCRLGAVISRGAGLLMLLAASLSFVCHCRARDAMSDDIVVADFESPTYGDWKTTGTAFKSGPASGDLPAKLELENFAGKGVATSKTDGDGPTGTLTSPAFKIERNYISFLIAGGKYEHHTCMNLLVDGKVAHSATGWNSVHLSPASWDVSKLRGQTARIQVVDDASGDWGHITVDQIVQTDKPERLPVVTQPPYDETFRPQFHFTARQWTVDRLNPGMRQEGWLNDLNGLIYVGGEYHLFAQRWNKCWIHATSRDLIHWTELEPAFWEEHLDSGVQSGTCVVDYDNSSGLSPDKATPPLVAFWSRNDNRSHCVSYSLDRGRTWKHYDKNPLLVHPNRDPKVFWYAPAKHWVMLLYGDSQYHVLTSQNLREWKDEHKPILNSFECPDIFELAVEGRRDSTKWVLIRGDGKYSTGRFDGTQFKEESEQLSCDIGPNFYATQTWANTERGDGRRIQAAWMRGGVYPDMPFNQQVTFPCELTLHNTSKGLRLFRKPIGEVALLHKRPDSWTNRSLKAGAILPLEPSGELYHIQAEVGIPEKARLTFDIRGVPLSLTASSIESGGATGAVVDSVKTVEILIDRTSIEAFVNGGEVSTSRCVLPDKSGLSVRADGGAVELRSLTVYPLKSAWKAE